VNALATGSITTKIFGRWSAEGVKISDVSLANYISLSAKTFPHSFGRFTKSRFEKREINIVERLINKIMRSGQGRRRLSGRYIRGRISCGKKLQAMKIVEKAFEIIEKETKQNPIQILVTIENSAPREDVTRFRKGGIAYTQAVDVAPLRRIDEALKNIAVATFSQSFNSKTSASEALAKELMLAAKNDNQSFSIKRKNEVERIAASSR